MVRDSGLRGDSAIGSLRRLSESAVQRRAAKHRGERAAKLRHRTLLPNPSGIGGQEAAESRERISFTRSNQFRISGVAPTSVGSVSIFAPALSATTCAVFRL